MCLSEVKKGQSVRIEQIGEACYRSQLIRFGITEGTCIECLEKIPFGPCMIRLNRQELAIGREVARTILVSEASLS